jgi:hypothetical protein
VVPSPDIFEMQAAAQDDCIVLATDGYATGRTGQQPGLLFLCSGQRRLPPVHILLLSLVMLLLAVPRASVLRGWLAMPLASFHKWPWTARLFYS